MSNLQDFGTKLQEEMRRSILQSVSGPIADNYLTPAPSVTTYTPPTYDQGRVGELTQELASPGLRRLRGVTREGVLNAYQQYDNPAAQGATIRRLLSGYGQGLEDVIGGARSGATTAYGQEYSPLLEASRLNWKTAEERRMDEWNKRMALNSLILENRLGEISAANRFREQRQLIADSTKANAKNTIIPSAGMMAGYYAPPISGPSSSGYWGNVSMSPQFQEPVFQSPSGPKPPAEAPTAPTDAGEWNLVRQFAVGLS